MKSGAKRLLPYQVEWCVSQALSCKSLNAVNNCPIIRNVFLIDYQEHFLGIDPRRRDIQTEMTWDNVAPTSIPSDNGSGGTTTTTPTGIPTTNTTHQNLNSHVQVVQPEMLMVFVSHQHQ
jgi:hypothetical protein